MEKGIISLMANYAFISQEAIINRVKARESSNPVEHQVI
jgi:hypothetical protein